MQGDVKVGLIIGVIVLALIVIVWAIREEPQPPAPAVGATSGTSENQDFLADWQVSSSTAVAPPVGTTSGQGATATTGVEEATQVTGTTTTTPPPTAKPREHVVQEHETLSKIAEKYYGSAAKVALIVKANKITDPNKIPVGTKLIIPADTSAATVTSTTSSGATTSAAGNVKKHVLQKGDTLWSLAEKYYGAGQGKQNTRILDANKDIIKDKDNLPVGKTLVIPMD